jgi:hypothetical protein
MKYYIQRHASGFVGNSFVWWRKGGNGYTCNIDEAEIFDGDDPKFQGIAKDGTKYTAWAQDYIDGIAHRHADVQFVDPAMKGVRSANTNLSGGYPSARKTC